MEPDSVNDIDFINLDANATDNAWIIDARVNTSWGDIDSALHFV